MPDIVPDEESNMAQANHTIVNPRTGQSMRFLVTSAESNGGHVRVETTHPAHGPIEADHFHPRQQSCLEVQSGTLRVKIKESEQVVPAGRRIIIPRNTSHACWNDGDEPAVVIEDYWPALQTQEYFETLFKLDHDAVLSAKGLPALLYIVTLVPNFGHEIRPSKPAWPLLQAMAIFFRPIAGNYRAALPAEMRNPWPARWRAWKAALLHAGQRKLPTSAAE